MKTNKKIAVTIGDPAGIGPEVTLKAVKMLVESGRFDYSNFLIIGNRKLLARACAGFIDRGFMGGLDVLHVESEGDGKIKTGRPSAQSGLASFEYIKAAAALASAGKLDALATAPISKEALHMAGFEFAGHTEILKSLCGARRVEMAFCGKYFNLLLMTRHVPLKCALKAISAEGIASAAVAGARFMRSAYPGSRKINIIVPGLNPHASENGLFGSEEKDIIVPGIALAATALDKLECGRGIEISGPVPADTAFYAAFKSREKTLILSYYHDQGLVPFKLLHFESGVNVTIGMPFIRTSPDHGTAYAIAGRNEASCLSMANAIKLALRMKPFEI